MARASRLKTLLCAVGAAGSDVSDAAAAAEGSGSSASSSGGGRHHAKGHRVRTILIIVAVAVVLVLYVWFHPSLNPQSFYLWVVIAVASLVALIVLLISSGHLREDQGRRLRRWCAIPGALLAVFVIGLVLSLPVFPGNAARYASVLEVEDGNFEQDIEEVDYSEVPVIDRDSAELLGDSALGTISDYVSQFEVADTYSQINYQGSPVRVSPLVYADIYKWWANRSEGIPGYVVVDMVTQEAEVVRLDEGIKYSESEHFLRNIDRYTQLRYPFYSFDQKSFELDEDGTPWWVFPVQKRTIGLFGGTTISRVVLVNACTGETYDYAVDECPEWVDRAYPADLLIEQYEWAGAYSNGWLNSWIGQQGVVTTTEGSDSSMSYNYLAQDGDIYLYTGVTSATADSSIVGFILVNQRTAEARYYAVAGATEDSAMSSAEGAVQDLGYEATYPLLLNVAGQPTYFMALKDDAGLVKMYAMICVEEYQEVATGDTVAETQEAYLAMLAADGTLTDEEAAEAAATEEVTGVIDGIAQAVIDGNSHFYITLEGSDAIYDVALPDLVGIVAFEVGDEITLTYVAEPDEDGVYEVVALG